MRKTYHVKNKCPRCGKIHNDVPMIDHRAVPYTGKVKPRFLCKDCIDFYQTVENRTDSGKGRQTTMFGLTESRGMAPEEKKKYDIDLELRGRKWREKWGIKVPSNYYYMSDWLERKLGLNSI